MKGLVISVAVIICLVGGGVYILYMCISYFDCITSVQTFVNIKDFNQKSFCYISTSNVEIGAVAE